MNKCLYRIFLLIILVTVSGCVAYTGPGYYNDCSYYYGYSYYYDCPYYDYDDYYYPNNNYFFFRGGWEFHDREGGHGRGERFEGHREHGGGHMEHGGRH